MGTNYCLSETNALILYHALRRLPSQLEKKNENVRHLRTKLAGMPGLFFQERTPFQEGEIFYSFVVQLDPTIWPKPKDVQEALTSELNCRIGRVYNPLNKNILYNPLSKRRNHLSTEQINSLKSGKEATLPNAEYIHETCVTFPHQMFLAEKEDINDISSALEKVYENRKLK